MAQLRDRVEAAIENFVNPKLLEHSGWVELVEVDGSTAKVRFRGACAACNSMLETADTVISPLLRSQVREIRGVEIVQELSPEVMEMAMGLFSHGTEEQY